jgi:hypothetical protein
MSPGTDGLQRRTTIETQAKSDGLRLLRAIDATQAHGLEGVRADPTRAVHEAGPDVGDVGSDRYHRAMEYLLEEGALVGDEHTATHTGDRQAHGYALRIIIAIEHERHQRAARAVPRAAKAHWVRSRPTELCHLAFCHDYCRVEADKTRGDFEEVDAAPGRRACSRSWRAAMGTSPIRTTPRRKS